MTPQQEKELYRDAIETFGIPAQVDVLIEEMAELTQGLLKWRRGKEGAWDNVHEELADVEIMLAQLKTGMNPKTIQKHKEYKLDRLNNLLMVHKFNNDALHPNDR